MEVLAPRSQITVSPSLALPTPPNPMTVRLFFSYVREDESLVRGVAARLKPPIEVWLDVLSLRLGEGYEKRIERQISEAAQFVVAFLSPASLASDFVRKELAWAMEREALLRRALPREMQDFSPFLLPVSLVPMRKLGPLEDGLRSHQISVVHRKGEASIAALLQQTVFNITADFFRLHRPTTALAFVDAIERQLTDFKDASFRLSACLEQDIGVLASPGLPQSQLTEAIHQYNALAKPLMQELPTYERKIRSTWGHAAADSFRELAELIERDVYRGQVYALNDVLARINEIEDRLPLSAEEASSANDSKRRACATAEAAIAHMVGKSASLVTFLRKDAGR